MIQIKEIKYILLTLLALVFYACGESAEDISFGYDHEVPQYEVLTDSLVVDPLTTVDLKVRISDNEGLSKYVFSYGNWAINKAEELDKAGIIKEFLFEMTITVPADAEKEWEETVIEKDGATRTIIQTYHKLEMTITDINMNVTKVPVYIKVR